MNLYNIGFFFYRTHKGFMLVLAFLFQRNADKNAQLAADREWVDNRHAPQQNAAFLQTQNAPLAGGDGSVQVLGKCGDGDGGIALQNIQNLAVERVEVVSGVHWAEVVVILWRIIGNFGSGRQK